MQCPKCKSDDLVKLSVIHFGGLSDLNAKSQGRAVMLGEQGLTLGFDNLTTSGTLQTRLSKLANPPHKKSYQIVLLVWFLGLAIAGWLLGYLTTLTHSPESLFDDRFRWFAYAYSCLAVFLLAGLWRYNHKIFPRRYEIWNRSFMCKRCGEVSQLSTHESGCRPRQIL